MTRTENTVASGSRAGGRYEIDPVTGEERLVEEATRPTPPPAEMPAEAPKKKVK
ncbi:MAG: hypothetical protein WAT70_10845 [Rhizobiaceae bacterium]